MGNGLLDIDAVRNYWNKRPCNIRHSSKEIGTIEYFNEVEKKKYFVEPHISLFANFPQWQNKKVLEIGCGIGTDAVNFIRNGADYFGLELSKESADIAKKRLEVLNLKGNIQVVNAESFDLKSEFDLIYSFGVIHHSPNPRNIIKCAHKHLKAGGEIRVMLYAKKSYKTAMIDAGFDQPEAQNGCPIAFTYDEADVHELFNEYFKISSIEQEHIFPYVIEEYVKGNYIKHKWFQEMPTEIFRVLEKNFGWHLLIKAIKI